MLSRVLVSRRHVLVIIAALCMTAGVLVFTGTATRALATQVSPPPLAGPTGLPDGRVYEQVTPTFKNGNYFDAQLELIFGLASADGDAVVYPMSGAVGEASSGMVTEFASKRTPSHGWQTVSTTPRATEAITLFSAPWAMVPSADFTHFLFASASSFVKEDSGTAIIGSGGVNLFISESPLVEPAWLGRPLVARPIPTLGSVPVGGYRIAGQSPDLDTVYFAYLGTLVPEDVSREQHVASGDGIEGWGFYEWHAGQLVSAGRLPDGSFNPFGAVPAAIAGESDRSSYVQAETIDNEVSEDGSRAYFVSPDPEASVVSNTFACEAIPPCSSEPPELYLREPGPGESKVSVLVSASELPGHEGEAAPDGVVAMLNSAAQLNVVSGITDTDIYASPDGSHAFFASQDQLTTAAPANSEVKIYDYDVQTGSLTYLPGVTAPIAQVSSSGSEALFENTATAPGQLELWHEGPGGGSVEAIAALGESQVNVNGAHVSENGSVVVFRTDAPIPGFNNTGGFNQIYRYDVPSDTLDCVSCPPKGVTPSGNARNSYDNTQEGKYNGSNENPLTTIEARGMSADGSRVFFDTPDALVPQDTNGLRDVYEWENGTVYLISSGASTEESFYLDNGADGGDVFFATNSGLVPADTDEAYDVYDARIPRPGDNPPAGAAPCKGAVCQGPPSVPQLLGAPASETFTGAGNSTPRPEVTKKAEPKKKKAKPKKKVKRKKKASTKSKGKRVVPAHRSSRHARHSKGRGK